MAPRIQVALVLHKHQLYLPCLTSRPSKFTVKMDSPPIFMLHKKFKYFPIVSFSVTHSLLDPLILIDYYISWISTEGWLVNQVNRRQIVSYTPPVAG